MADLMEAEEPIAASASADAIREAAADLEPSVRAATGSTADYDLTARVRLDHYHQLVRGQLRLALAAGEPIRSLAQRARRSVPYWTDTQIADLLTDRGATRCCGPTCGHTPPE